ncbi:MAG: hypothetical protein PHO75_01315 [Candidatus Shapirobacteria bacterium]|nr:hypothetical protein [Candidatus Shapirobacteria bacterium]
MKKIIFFLLFLSLPFLKPVFIFSQTPTLIATQSSNTSPQPNIFTLFLNWVLGLFVKTDYNISSREISKINSDMTDYGDVNNPDEYKTKHSFAGSRSTSSNSQNCLKGNIIKKVILGTDSNNTSLSKICFDSSNKCFIDSSSTDSICKTITIKDLAHYFVQQNKPFYCDSNDNSVEIEQNIIDKTNQSYSTAIPQNELSCYQQIYDDFYLTPKQTSDTEENTNKIIKTPISDKDQKEGASNSDLQKQLDQNFSPDGSSAGLYGLRPASW